MKMLSRISLLCVCAAVAALSIVGCGGSGTSAVAASPFAGNRYIGFYDEDGSNSSWMGNLEVIIASDGSFEPNGAIYTSSSPGMVTNRAALDTLIANRHSATRGGPGGGGGYESHEGTITVGSIKNDGTFHFEARIDQQGWPTSPLDDPYIMVGDGQVTRRGHHWEGTGTIRYYDMNPDGSAGDIRKEIPYDFGVTAGGY